MYSATGPGTRPAGLPPRARSFLRSVAEILNDPPSKTSRRFWRPATSGIARPCPTNGSRWNAAIRASRTISSGSFHFRKPASASVPISSQSSSRKNRAERAESVSTAYDGGSRSSSSKERTQSGRPSIASATMATRCRASVGGAPLSGDTRAGIQITRARPNLSAARATGFTWPSWTGSNVPPKMPMRTGEAYLASAGRGGFPTHAVEEVMGERLRAAVRDRGDRVEGQPARGCGTGDRGWPIRIRNGVDLRSDENPGARGGLGRELPELLFEDFDVILRVSRAGGVDQMAEQAAPLDVLQKTDAEPGAAVGAGDQPRDIRHDQGPAVVAGDDPEMGNERRERIVGDLRLRRGDRRDERRLAGVRKADDRDVG